VSQKTFQDFSLDENLLLALDKLGFVYPTDIQEKAIPEILKSSNDFVGQAQTGTGKTFAFAIPLLQKIDHASLKVQALILAPTRELAQQVEVEIQKLTIHQDIKSICLFGGTEFEPQLRGLQSNPQIVVGTPGRVLDLLKKKKLKLDSAKICVLDEADEMLTMGFIEDVEVILDYFNGNRQLIMFSATMPNKITTLIKSIFRKPTFVKIENVSLSNDDIEQSYFVVKDKHFKEALGRLISDADDIYAMVFCRTKLETKVVADDLKKRGHSVEVLNGDMGQAERDDAMNNFKKKKVNIMVCTDVAARGIDVDTLTHVINYGPPRDNESYVHRIGRTGRAGLKGKAYTIIGPGSVSDIKSLEGHLNKKIEKKSLPSISSLIENLVKKEVLAAGFIKDAIQSKGDDFKIDPSFVIVEEEFAELSKEEILKLMFVWKFNKEMRHLNNLSDIEKINPNKKTKVNKKRKNVRNRES
jgi:ATP-dependent RNA helicase DeaD